MKILEIELPSNRKFGFFFTLVFAVFAVFFFYFANVILASAFLATSSILLFITLIKADFLLPLNKIWMQFGLLIGMIVSPIVLGIIFFGLVTPYGVSMKMFGRDELKLKFTKRSSYWIKRIEPIKSESFKRQF